MDTGMGTGTTCDKVMGTSTGTRPWIRIWVRDHGYGYHGYLYGHGSRMSSRG